MLNVSIFREPLLRAGLTSRRRALCRTTYDDLPAWRAAHAHFPRQWQVPDNSLPDEETLSWRGCSIHVDRYRNDRSSTRLVLLHGLGTNARMMTCIAGHALSRLGYDVSAPDMPYVGATRTSHDWFAYNDWVQLVTGFIELISERDDRPVVLFGFSVGGMLAYDVSCINHRVAGVCASCFIDLSDRDVRRAIATNPGWNMMMERVGGALVKSRVKLKVPLETFANRKTISNDPSLNDILARDRSSLGGRFPLAFLDSLRRHSPTVAPEAYKTVPVALLQAELDYNIPPSTNRRFFDRIAGSKRYVELPSAGHIPLNVDALRMMVGEIDQFVCDCVAQR